MKVGFRQGIVSHQSSFLQKNASDGIDILANNAPVVLTIAHKDNNYLFYEPISITSAWSSTFDGIFSWLYWDINPVTGERTFGQTSIKPIVSASTPITGHDEYGIPLVIEGRHWYNTANNVHLIKTAYGWREVIRIFAARIVPNATIIESYFNNSTFTGSQIFNNTNIHAGRVLFDDTGRPIIRNNKTFSTTENKIFASALRVDAFRLESNVIHTISEQNIAAYTIVSFIGIQDKIRISQYNDIGVYNMGILMNDVMVGENASVVMQGVIANPLWDFSSVGDAQLWVDNGNLVSINPHITNQSLYPKNKEPIAKALTKNSINFKSLINSNTIEVVDSEVELPLATINDLGVSKLSVPAVNDENPIVVGDNDPRLSDSRTPLAHTHTASSITLIPALNGHDNVLQSLTWLHNEMDGKVNRSGDILSGFLTLHSNPVDLLHAVPKQYVDNMDGILQTNIDNKVSKSGDTMTGNLIISPSAKITSAYVPTIDSDVVNKLYVDSLFEDFEPPVSTPLALPDLTDVSDTLFPDTNELLIYDGLQQKWTTNINVNLKGNSVIRPNLVSQNYKVNTNASIIAEVLYIDLAYGTYIPITLTSNITSIVITNPDILDGTILYDITIIFKQSSSTLYTVGYNVPIYFWPNAIPHAMTQSANAIDIINMISLSPFTWHCFIKGQNMGVAGDSGPPR